LSFDEAAPHQMQMKMSCHPTITFSIGHSEISSMNP
jgi:hypothetical protein